MTHDPATCWWCLNAGPPESTEEEAIQAYAKLAHEEVTRHFSSPEFQKRIDDAINAEGYIPDGFDIGAHCGWAPDA
jgi:hypothetical protein